jgi:TDG/mug DNA glycosylase family protein
MKGAYQRIYASVSRIPAGRVATYGEIALLAEIPGGARQVGYALHALTDPGRVPWHRVVNAQGRISTRSEPGYAELQRALLEREGVRFGAGDRISLARFAWRAARRPSRHELLQAAGRTIPDVIGPGLRVLFCGINPGLYSAATGFHFAGPGNRFWPALNASGFTDRRLQPAEQRTLLEYGCGITNLVARATAGAAELSHAELQAGRRRLEAKLRRHRPRSVAVLGLGAYRAAFHRPRAHAGRQRDRLAGASLFVLPNPSGLNARYPLSSLTRLFRLLRLSQEPVEHRPHVSSAWGQSPGSPPEDGEG